MKPKQIISKPVAIYLIENTINSKIYIGQSVNPKTRFRQHKNHKGRSKLSNAMRSYGADKFTLNVLYWYDNKEQADIIEKRLIAELNTRVIGYNIAVGGEGTGSGKDSPRYGVESSSETKAKLSEFRKTAQAAIEHQQRMSAANVGRKHSPETLARMSETRKGRKQSAEHIAKRLTIKTPEHIEKVAAFHRGRKRSDETRAKISAAAKSRSLKRKEATE